MRKKTRTIGNWAFKYRGIIPVFVLSIGLSIYAFRLNNDLGKSANANELFRWGCFGLASLGEILRIFTVGYAPKGTSGRNTNRQVAEYLNTTGMYSIVRNPLYLGNFLIWLGIALLVEHTIFVIAFSLFFSGFYWLIIKVEEDFLTSTYGQKYLNWAQSTPAFIPCWKNYSSSERSFNWKKVFRKEKNGITAIFIVFGLFALVKDLFNGDFSFLQWRPNMIWYLLAIAGILFYSAIKIVIKTTSWLENREHKI